MPTHVRMNQNTLTYDMSTNTNICRNMSTDTDVYTDICYKMSRFQYTSTYTDGCWDMVTSVRIKQDLLAHVERCRHISMYAAWGQYMSIHVDKHQYKPRCISICRSMSTYVSICRHAKTPVEMCRQFDIYRYMATNIELWRQQLECHSKCSYMTTCRDMSSRIHIYIYTYIYIYTHVYV